VTPDKLAPLFLRYEQEAPNEPHIWILETRSGMWVATFPKLDGETAIGEQARYGRLIAKAVDMAALLAEFRDYLSHVPESAAGGDDDTVTLVKRATRMLKEHGL
jgi:hypothetical protein